MVIDGGYERIGREKSNESNGSYYQHQLTLTGSHTPPSKKKSSMLAYRLAFSLLLALQFLLSFHFLRCASYSLSKYPNCSVFYFVYVIFPSSSASLPNLIHDSA
ncbi:MAG: hypothetical protein J3Q66DRAFT_162125 [Benniella sp.]|nr:MAG: hypothetical protein J3Q66DRAFT_162125 [Benniella sp.]